MNSKTLRQSNELNRYAAHKEAARRRNAAMSAGGREIGEIPKVKHPKRKKECRSDLRKFLETYFSESFYIEWSEDHKKAIARIESTVLKGGLFAFAMPRGSGKTTMLVAAALWAILYGHRCFVVLVGATEDAATELLTDIKTIIETNEKIMEDFPEACYPIEKLDGIVNRANGQLYNGKRTRIRWKDDYIVFPTIEGSAASGAVIRVAGITGRIRGMKAKRADGRDIRPDLVLVDDPQTRESALSVKQTKDRVRILNGDILGLAGPKKKISGFMPCTVISKEDMADQILDPAKHPSWNGERTKFCYAFPTDEKLWEKYREIYEESMRTDHNFSAATEFYRKNREAMDAGCVPAWKERFDGDELSAVQNIMNLKIRDEEAFMAEYQNEPLAENDQSADQMTTELILSRLNGLKALVLPAETAKVTMFIDVMDKFLAYVICAWQEDFTGAVVDYGTFPKQPTADFTVADARATLSKRFPNMGPEGYLTEGLKALVSETMQREFVREDGVVMKVGRILVDANWGEFTNLVYRFCQRSEYSHIIFPSHGRFISVTARPISQYTRKQGEKIGLEWQIKKTWRADIRHVTFDTNYWKSFIRRRFNTAPADKGSLTLSGRKPNVHRFFAEHMTAEKFESVTGSTRTMDQWKLPVGKTENHWFDGVVGCAVAASIEGITLPGNSLPTVRKRIIRMIKPPPDILVP